MKIYQIYNFCNVLSEFESQTEMLLGDNRHNNLTLPAERGARPCSPLVVITTMSTMNDVHQFRVRTPSFLISADNNMPVQVRMLVVMVVVVTTLRLDTIFR